MRLLLAPLLLAPLTALAAPDILADFEPALEQIPSTNNETETRAEDGSFELLKRQGNTCATSYYACSNLGAAGLCCPQTAICSADQRGQVACCPQGAACTGALGGTGSIQTASATQTASSTVSFVVASTTQSPFVQQTNGANAGSTVQNQFYPFPYIPTTYTNAAACSSAYTSCQSDAASCTSALANGAAGVTISAPNGGATITAIPSVGLQSAQSICASLSSAGCYQLTVEACTSFDGVTGGNAAARERCRAYMMGAGVAVGIAGQLLQ
ncbi:Nn.00g017420.m01.CDS01 [Neocucurbitaria sp. VM-36]